MTEAAWGRGLLVSSAVADNAVLVAEYTLAMVISAGKTVYYVDCSAASDGSGSSSSPWNALTDPDGMSSPPATRCPSRPGPPATAR